MPQTHMRLILPITGDIIFDHLVKVESTRFLLCKVTTFLVVINMYLVRRWLETVQISYFSPDIHSLILVIIGLYS